MMDAALSHQLTTSGSLSEFCLTDVLQALSLGRQYLQIDVHDADSNNLGRIGLKAGHVVDARQGGLTGKAAFAALCRLPKEGFFRITRIEVPTIPEPIGRLQELLLDVLVREAPPPLPSRQSDPRLLSDPAKDQTKVVRVPLSRSLGRDTSEAPHRAGVAVALASPKGGVGKTTLAVNLANALAGPRRRVLLVDGSVNGDVLAALNAQHRARAGVVEVIAGETSLDAALLPTANPHLKILPAFGPRVGVPERAADPGAEQWRRLIDQTTERAEVVLVDTPAGLFGATQAILGAITHVLGVLQAEPMAVRFSDRFGRMMGSLPRPGPPALVGIVLNMLQADCESSTDVLKDLGRLGTPPLFQSFLPRSSEVLRASREGQPLQFLGESPMAALFAAVAAELAERLGLNRNDGPRTRFLA